MSVLKDFPGLEYLEKIKDFQGPARALHMMNYNNCETVSDDTVCDTNHQIICSNLTFHII